MVKKATAILVSLAVALGAFAVTAAEESARVITIYKTEGSGVTMTKGAAQSFAAKEGVKLFDGYTVSTDKKSFCQLKMDEESLLKMDSESKIQVSKASSKKLSVAVLSGGVSVNAAPQKQGDTLEVRAGNSALAVRGTLFTAEFLPEGSFVVSMLSGRGEVDGRPLPAGRTMLVSDIENSKQHEIVELKIDKSLSSLVLNTIQENKETLVESGAFTQQEVATVPVLITEAEKVRETAPPPEVIPVNEVKYTEVTEAPPAAQTPQTQTPQPQETPTPPVTGGGSGGSSSSPKAYTVTYNVNGGTGTAPTETPKANGSTFTAASGSGMTPPAGMAFIRWNTKSNGSGTAYAAGATITMSANNLELFAIWEYASGTTPDGYSYKMSADGATITGYSGPTNIGITVPGDINGRPVVAIGDSAFLSRNDISGTLTLPNSLLTIGDSAFKQCGSLSGSVIIPDSVTSIGASAFLSCRGFNDSIVIGNSVRTIGESAFWTCDGLSGTLTLGNSVTTIGDSAFNNCHGITGTLVLPNSVTTIGDGAFKYCSGMLPSLSMIPNSVRSIGSEAFYECGSVTGTMTISSSVRSIGTGAFANCGGLATVIFEGDVPAPFGPDLFALRYQTLDVYYPAAYAVKWQNITDSELGQGYTFNLIEQ